MPDEDTMYQIWREIMTEAFAKLTLIEFIKFNLSDFSRAKIYATYGFQRTLDNRPLDYFYSETLQHRINELIRTLQEPYEKAENLQLLEDINNAATIPEMVSQIPQTINQSLTSQSRVPHREAVTYGRFFPSQTSQTSTLQPAVKPPGETLGIK